MKLLPHTTHERLPPLLSAFVSAMLWFPTTADALFQEFDTIEELEWGVAAVRTATIPYAS